MTLGEVITTSSVALGSNAVEINHALHSPRASVPASSQHRASNRKVDSQLSLLGSCLHSFMLPQRDHTPRVVKSLYSGMVICRSYVYGPLSPQNNMYNEVN